MVSAVFIVEEVSPMRQAQYIQGMPMRCQDAAAHAAACMLSLTLYIDEGIRQIVARRTMQLCLIYADLPSIDSISNRGSID